MKKVKKRLVVWGFLVIFVSVNGRNGNRHTPEVTAKILGHGLKITQHYQKMFSDTVMDAFGAIK